MCGNVWEWCEDELHENYINAPADGSAWLDKNSELRLLRGGSWDSYPVICRSAFRGNSYLVDDYGIGFRVVCGGAART